MCWRRPASLARCVRIFSGRLCLTSRLCGPQDNCPTEFKAGEARAAAEKELGRPLSEVFERWDDTPLAVASIGEVHGARLRPEIMASLAAAGEPLESPEVVVKIQLPNIKRRFRADIKTIITFCTLAMPQHVPPMQEIEKQFLTEFDYTLEAANLQEVRTNVLNARDRAGRRWDEVRLCPHGLCLSCLVALQCVCRRCVAFNAMLAARAARAAHPAHAVNARSESLFPCQQRHSALRAC